MALPLLLWLACSGEPGTPHPVDDTGSGTADLQLRLRWIGGQPELTWARAQEGLWWSLSLLGAQPRDPGALVLLSSPSDKTVTFSLDLGAVGFPEEALPTVAEVVTELRQDPSLDHHDGVDVGRFLMRLLYEPWRYYAITGACDTLEDWEARHLDLDAVVTYAVTDSLLIEGHRLIDFEPGPAEASQIAFRSLELLDDIGPGADVPPVGEQEVIDLMPSGQQRFAVYGDDHRLRPAADPALSPAGQPGRCMWRHEGRLQIGQPNPDIEGYWTYDQFFEELSDQLQLIQDYRATLDTRVNFREYHVHTWGELLVEEFLQPAPARVALEWGLSEAEVGALGLARHESEEYPGWGKVFWRADVDALLEAREGWRPTPTLDSSRVLDPDDPRLAPATLRDCR